MKILLPLLAALALAAPAMAQVAKLPESRPSPEQVLAAATPEAAAVFAIDPPRGLIHRPSGYACPSTSGSAALMSVSLQGDVAACRYADSFQPVITLEFLPPGPADVLTRSYCEALPKALNVDLGPPLPGARRLEGPSTPSRLGKVLVKGEWTPILQCIWARPPFNELSIVIDASAMRPAGGWAARLIQTQARPGNGRNPMYSSFDLLRPMFLLGAVVAGEDAPHS